MAKKKHSEFELYEKNPNMGDPPKYNPADYPEWFSKEPIDFKTYNPSRTVDFLEKAHYLISNGYPVHTQDPMELANFLAEGVDTKA